MKGEGNGRRDERKIRANSEVRPKTPRILKCKEKEESEATSW